MTAPVDTGVAAADAPRKARLADEIEARAFVDLYAAAPPDLAAQLGLTVRRHAGATVLLATGLPTPMFNRVIGLGADAPAGTSDVEHVARAYRDAGVSSWWLHWSPHAQPADMPARLAALGFSAPPRRAWMKFVRDAAPVSAVLTDLDVRRADDASAAATARAIAAAYEMPPFMADWIRGLLGRPRWTLWRAADGDRVVGGGALFVDDMDGQRVGWLGLGGVLAGHRRRGGQRALLAARCAAAIAHGAHLLATETGEPIADEPNPSLRNIARAGFTGVASRLNFAGPA
jgi:hypothetical protein